MYEKHIIYDLIPPGQLYYYVPISQALPTGGAISASTQTGYFSMDLQQNTLRTASEVMVKTLDDALGKMLSVQPELLAA